MKKQSVLLIIIGIFSCLFLKAQQQKISLTGFNSDVIADPDLNAAPDTLTNNTVDGAWYVFFTQGYSNNAIPFANGLPQSGIMLSKTGHYFQLQPANVSNDLQVNFFENYNGTLTFSAADQIPYDSLFILAASGSGANHVAYTVNFTDNTTSPGNFTVADWYCNGCTNYAMDSLSKIIITDGSITQARRFALYEYPIVLSPADRVKQVKSIDFSAPDENTSFANIFAISGSGPSVLPVALEYFNATVKNNQAVLQWKTAQEHDSRLYIIDRASKEAPHVFTRVGSVAAIPSATGSSYQFLDKAGLSGTYLYRLSRQDADGNIKVIDIRSLTFGLARNWTIQDLGNQWKLLATGAFTYRLTDIGGKLLQSSSGSGAITINKPSAKGIYFIQVSAGNQIFSKTLLR